MIRHSDISDAQLRSLIHLGKIILAGNARLKIFGVLSCSSGKRMLKSNRVFFATKKEAIHHGFRPCGHCLNTDYKRWKKKLLGA